MSQQCVLVAKRTNHILGCISFSITRWSREVIDPAKGKGPLKCPLKRKLFYDSMIFPFYSALMWPHLKSCVQLWASQCKKDITLEECVQRRVTKMVKWLEDKKRILRGDLISAYNFLSGCSGGGGVALLSLVTCDGPQGNGIQRSSDLTLGKGSSSRGWSVTP